MEHRGTPDGWASWFLVLAATLPAAAAAHLGWVVLGGSVDDVFGGQDPPLTGVDLLGTRWSNLWMTSSLPTLLLTGLLPLVVLAALVVAGRPHALVPTGTARGVATLVAGVTAALGLAGVVGFVAQLAGLLPVLTWSSPTGSKLDGFAPAAAAVLTTAVLGVAATAVLRPRGPATPDDDQSDDQPGDDRTGDDRPVDGVAVDGAVDGAGRHRVAPRTVAAAPEPPQVPVPQGFPTASATDLDLYRRR